MKALLEAKSNCNLSHVDVESPNKNGRTPFHIACIYGHYEVAKTLIENGEANPMVRHNKYPISYYNIHNNYSLCSKQFENSTIFNILGCRSELYHSFAPPFKWRAPYLSIR